MNTWQHVACVATLIHEALMSWSRRLLRDAGRESVEVYGQFPPQGTVGHHLVLFPYRVHPEPKVAENAPGLSLFGSGERNPDRGVFTPPPWLELGRAVSSALERLFPDGSPTIGGRGRQPLPLPLLSTMPRPLAGWYAERAAEDPESGWLFEHDGMTYGRPPSLWWHPPITITSRYIAVAHEPGRGTAERTLASAPMSVPVLSVLAAGLHLERVIRVELPPLPFPPEVTSLAEAVVECLRLRVGEGEGKGEGKAEALARRIEGALVGVNRHATYPIPVLPVHDLNNHEFALLMQALQRPLQPALNLSIQLPLGAQVTLNASAGMDVRMRVADPQRARAPERPDADPTLARSA